LYFSIVMKLSHSDTTVAVLERHPAGATYGWGVVFWDDFLASLHRSDPRTAQAVRSSR
jgi:anthraniloyl-CoA monooxygenase